MGSGYLRVLNKFSTFVNRGSSHRRKSAACPWFYMVWLNRSPIPVGRRGKICLVQMISTCLPSRRGRGLGVGTLRWVRGCVIQGWLCTGVVCRGAALRKKDDAVGVIRGRLPLTSLQKPSAVCLDPNPATITFSSKIRIRICFNFLAPDKKNSLVFEQISDILYNWPKRWKI